MDSLISMVLMVLFFRPLNIMIMSSRPGDNYEVKLMIFLFEVWERTLISIFFDFLEIW